MSIWKRLFGNRSNSPARASEKSAHPDPSATPSANLEGNAAPFLVFLAGSGIDRQQVLAAVSQWKGNHESSFTANLDMKIGRNPSGDVVMISTRTNDSANHSAMQSDLESTFQKRGIPLERK